jgi:hypothetical protein
MTVVNNLNQLYPLSFRSSKVGLEEGLGTPIVTISSGSYNTISRAVTLNFSDGRTVIFKDIPFDEWSQLKAEAGI